MDIYLHQDAPTEPAGDGSIKTTAFDDADTEFSGNAPFVKGFTSETGFFTKDQTLSGTWTIHFNAKYANKTSGYTPFIRFIFYKRNASNTDTYLFQTAKFSIGTLYDFSGLTGTRTASGSVLTTDRLRILVYMNEEIPA